MINYQPARDIEAGSIRSKQCETERGNILMANKLNRDLLPKRYVVAMGSRMVFEDLAGVAVALDALERSLGAREYLSRPDDWDLGEHFYANCVAECPDVDVSTERIGTLEEMKAALVPAVDPDGE